MTRAEKLDFFYSKETPWKEALARLRSYLISTELQEDWKWRFPTYTWNGKNVVATASFKNHFGLWFFQGALLKDPYDLLHNAQVGKTKTMRHLHFTKPEDVPMNIVKQYIQEAITNTKNGKKVLIERGSKKVVTPERLKDELRNNVTLNTYYGKLSLSKQREYCQYINEAKKETTKNRRLEKIIPMILEGKCLNDTYRK